jgi:hypothetical protein
MALQQLIQNYSAKRDKIRSGVPAFETAVAEASQGGRGSGVVGSSADVEDDPAR